MKQLPLIINIAILSGLFISCGKNEKPSGRNPGNVDTGAESKSDSVQSETKPVEFSYAERKGKHLFEQYCVICHGVRGEADGFNAYNLNPKPHSLADSAYVEAFSDDALRQVITFGGRGVNKSVLMPAYGWTIGEDQVSYLVSYLRVLAHNVPGKMEP